MIILLYMIIKQKEKTEKKEKERNTTAGIVPLKGHIFTLFTPKSFIVVH